MARRLALVDLPSHLCGHPDAPGSSSCSSRAAVLTPSLYDDFAKVHEDLLLLSLPT
jgi:hypothetical protein